MKNVLVILLTYYPEYCSKAIAALQSVLRLSKLPYQILVVANGNTPKDIPDDIEFIPGNNAWHEFSGWQVALEFAEEKYGLNSFSCVVLANDTLCHHNRFGLITRWAFARALRSVAMSPNASAAGECWAFDSEYEVLGHRGRKWIASYFIAISAMAIRMALPLVPTTFERPSTPDDCFRIFGASEKLKRHIERWLGLTPVAHGKPRWYAAHSDRSVKDLEKLASKTASILLEFNLSARLSGTESSLIDVFSSPWIRQARRLEKRPVIHRSTGTE